MNGTYPEGQSDQSGPLNEALRGLRNDGSRIVVDQAVAGEIVPTPSEAQARREMAEAEQAMAEHRRVDAVAAYTRAVINDATNADGMHGLAASLHAAGLSHHACVAQQSAIDLEPGASEHQEALVLYAQSAGEFPTAIRACQNLLTLRPDHPTGRGRLAVLYYFSEDFAAAWAEVHAAEPAGQSAPPQLRALLEEQLPEPRR